MFQSIEVTKGKICPEVSDPIHLTHKETENPLSVLTIEDHRIIDSLVPSNKWKHQGEYI